MEGRVDSQGGPPLFMAVQNIVFVLICERGAFVSTAAGECSGHTRLGTGSLGAPAQFCSLFGWVAQGGQALGVREGANTGLQGEALHALKSGHTLRWHGLDPSESVASGR